MRDENATVVYPVLLRALEEVPFVPLWQLDTPVVLSSKLQLPFPPDRLDPLTVFTMVEEWKLAR